MTLRIRQIVFAARDLEPTVDQFRQALGLQIAYRDPQVGEFGLENALLPIGDQFLEVVSPTRDGTAAGRHLERHGDSAYMLIFQTDDLPRDKARFEKLGVRLVWQSSYPDISAVHLHPKDIGAAIVSVDQPVPPESWRWAGPDWQKRVAKEGAQQVLEATISAVDPAAMAERWSQVLGLETPRKSGTGHRISIGGGALNFVAGKSDLITDYLLATNDASSNRTATLCGTTLRLIA